MKVLIAMIVLLSLNFMGARKTKLSRKIKSKKGIVHQLQNSNLMPGDCQLEEMHSCKESGINLCVVTKKTSFFCLATQYTGFKIICLEKDEPSGAELSSESEEMSKALKFEGCANKFIETLNLNKDSQQPGNFQKSINFLNRQKANAMSSVVTQAHEKEPTTHEIAYLTSLQKDGLLEKDLLEKWHYGSYPNVFVLSKEEVNAISNSKDHVFKDYPANATQANLLKFQKEKILLPDCIDKTYGILQSCDKTPLNMCKRMKEQMKKEQQNQDKLSPFTACLYFYKDKIELLCLKSEKSFDVKKTWKANELVKLGHCEPEETVDSYNFYHINALLRL